MSLKETITSDIQKAMLARDKKTADALKAIKSELLLLETSKEAKDGISESMEIACLQKLIKQRKEAADIYKTQNRADLYEEEMAQAAVIERYLPAQLSKEEVENIIKEVIAQVGATSPKDMGKVMGVVSKQLAGKADNKMVAELVKGLLQ